MEKIDLANNVDFFDLFDSKLKKARFYGSKMKINLNCILFSYYELIIWRNRQLFLIRCVMLACLFTEQNYHSDKKIIN